MTLVQEMELMDAFIIQVFENEKFWKLAGAHDRLVMDAVTILKLDAEMKLFDAFVMDVFAKDTFLNHRVAHSRLVIYAVTYWHWSNKWN